MARQALRIIWRHYDDECEAVVGEQLRWAPVDRKTGHRRSSWSSGPTVLAIDDGPPCWRVFLNPEQRAEGWANPIHCGEQPTVVEYDLPSG